MVIYFLIIFLFQDVLAQSIMSIDPMDKPEDFCKNIMSKPEKKRKFKSKDDLLNYLCSQISNNDSIAKINQFDLIINKILDNYSNVDEIRSSKDFDLLMNEFDKLQVNEAESDQFTMSLSNFIKEYGPEKIRSKNNYDDYIKAAEEVLKHHELGKKSLNCFKSCSGSHISSTAKYELDSSAGTGNFRVVETTERPGVYDKVIIINPNLDPLKLLRLLVHEMQHSCRCESHASHKHSYTETLNALNLFDELNKKGKLTQNSEEKKQTRQELESKYIKARSQYIQNAALDEMTAYSIDTQFSLDLIKAVPEIACKQKSRNLEIGKLQSFVLNTSIRYKSIKDGTFPMKIIKKYNEMGIYKTEDVFEDNKTIKQDLYDKIKAEGHKIVK